MGVEDEADIPLPGNVQEDGACDNENLHSSSEKAADNGQNSGPVVQAASAAIKPVLDCGQTLRPVDQDEATPSTTCEIGDRRGSEATPDAMVLLASVIERVVANSSGVRSVHSDTPLNAEPSTPRVDA